MPTGQPLFQINLIDTLTSKLHAIDKKLHLNAEKSIFPANSLMKCKATDLTQAVSRKFVTYLQDTVVGGQETRNRAPKTKLGLKGTRNCSKCGLPQHK